MIFNSSSIPVPVIFITNELSKNGHEAYICGGALRDLYLYRPIHDWDICTSATPEEIMQTFPNEKIIPTGLQHGTVSIVIDDIPYEVTTYRIDGEYLDNRRPDNVTFTKNVFDDLKRRDFTINAMAYSLQLGFTDPFNGLYDINRKIIRCVGNPDERFNEDGLRILRAIRFAAQLEFSIEEETAKSIHKNKYLLRNISRERIQSELFKILESPNCGVNVLREYADVICVCIPEIEPMIGFNQNNPYHTYDVWEHSLHSLKACSLFSKNLSDIILRLAVLLHDIGKPHCYSEDEKGIGHFYGHAVVSWSIARCVLKELKCSNEVIENVIELIEKHDVTFTPTKAAVKRLLNKLGEEQLKRLFCLRIADVEGHGEVDKKERIHKVYLMGEILNEILEENECFSLKDLAINGNDLISLGIPIGKQIGETLNILLNMVINDEIKNNKEELIKYVNERGNDYD